MGAECTFALCDGPLGFSISKWDSAQFFCSEPQSFCSEHNECKAGRKTGPSVITQGCRSKVFPIWWPHSHKSGLGYDGV